jgi:hypothetical protein
MAASFVANALWRSSMRDIVTAIRDHFNYRHDSQVADFIGISRQHIHVAVRENRLVPDKLLEACIQHQIDISRLLRDGKAVNLSDVNYDESQLTVSIYEEGSVIPKRENALPKWYLEKMIGRSIDINERFAIVHVESDEMEPKITAGSTVFLDTSTKEPKSGLFYLEVNGYGFIRKLVKAREESDWFLSSTSSQQHQEPMGFPNDFSIIGKVRGVTTMM